MRIILGDLLTGRRILDVPFVSADWSAELNGAGSVKCKVDLRDPAVRALGLRNSATPGKAFLGAVVGDRFMEAGPVWSRKYDRSDGMLELSALGLWSYFDRRTVLPNIGDLPVIDPVTGESAGYANSVWYGLHLGTIGKRLVEQAVTWPDGNVPVVFEADKPGTHERSYVGAELSRVGDMLSNLTEVEDGPDIAFLPEWSADRLGVRWRYVSGDPRLASLGDHLIDASVPVSPVDDLTVDESGSYLGARAWASGGRSAGASIIARYDDPTLTTAGFPLMERVDSSRSTVQLQATMQAHAVELARNSHKPLSKWSLQVHVGGAGEPVAEQFNVGDYVKFTVRDDLFIPDGKYRRRIVNMSGDQDGSFVKLGLGEDYG